MKKKEYLQKNLREAQKAREKENFWMREIRKKKKEKNLQPEQTSTANSRKIAAKNRKKVKRESIH